MHIQHLVLRKYPVYYGNVIFPKMKILPPSHMHETKAVTVTEVIKRVIKREHLRNRSEARHCRAWIHLYIARGTEEE